MVVLISKRTNVSNESNDEKRYNVKIVVEDENVQKVVTFSFFANLDNLIEFVETIRSSYSFQIVEFVETLRTSYSFQVVENVENDEIVVYDN